MASSGEATFARLIPVNYLAQRLLRDTVEASEAAANTYRLKFVEQSPNTQDDAGLAGAEAALAEELSSLDRNLILSLNPELEPKNLSHGWRVGKENQPSKNKKPSVELVVAEPSSPFARTIANVAAFFRFHPKSALLLVVAASDEKPISILYDGEWTRVGMREARVLYQPVTRLKFGDLEYELKYTVEESEVESFIKLRDDFIYRASGCVPAVPWSLPPYISFEKRGPALFSRSMGHGTFTITSRGVDCESGDLLAIKELQLKSTGDLRRATLEMQVASTCSAMDGHLPLQVSWCEHGHQTPCKLLPERFFMAFPLGVTDFSKLSWTPMPPEVRTELLLQILKAISRMHQAGFMHRDISLKNMLLVTQDPPTAALIDYGKSIQAAYHDDSRIGPIPTVAPEVAEGHTYTSKVDVWSWAYAVAEIYGYSFKPVPGEVLWITPKRLARIQKHMRSLTPKDPADQKLIELAMYTLIWKPDERPTAEAVLKDKSWGLGRTTPQLETPTLKEERSITGTKRIKKDSSELLPATTASPATTATDPLSQSPEFYLAKRIKIEEKTQ